MWNSGLIMSKKFSLTARWIIENSNEKRITKLVLRWMISLADLYWNNCVELMRRQHLSRLGRLIAMTETDVKSQFEWCWWQKQKSWLKQGGDVPTELWRHVGKYLSFRLCVFTRWVPSWHNRRWRQVNRLPSNQALVAFQPCPNGRWFLLAVRYVSLVAYHRSVCMDNNKRSDRVSVGSLRQWILVAGRNQQTLLFF